MPSPAIRIQIKQVEMTNGNRIGEPRNETSDCVTGPKFNNGK